MKICFITVNFNNRQGLRSTVDSVKMFRDKVGCEVKQVIVDGGSTDGSADTDFPDFTEIVSEQDDGIFDAMNKGIALSDSGWLCFLNSGDQIEESNATLIEQILAAHGDSSAVVFDCLFDFYPYRFFTPIRRTLLTIFQVRGFWLFGLPAHPSIFFKKESLQQLFYDWQCFPDIADSVFIDEIIRTGKIVCFPSTVSSLFFCGGVSTTKTSLRQCMRIFGQRLKMIKRRGWQWFSFGLFFEFFRLIKSVCRWIITPVKSLSFVSFLI